METVKEYDAIFERAKRRLCDSAAELNGEDLRRIASKIGVSFQLVYDYTKRRIGTKLRTTLEIQEAVLKYKNEKKQK